VTDWAFASGETLYGEGWFAAPQHYGPVRMRGIPDGPDNEIDDIRLVILGALAVAEKRVDIVTPYFLPDESIINAMNIAAMKGVQVRVLLPAQNNIRLVQWAQSDPISNVLSRGCQVFETSPPFDHTKLMLVDSDWALIGSSNWDPRSLRLNFEFNMECYDQDLVSRLDILVEQKLAQSRQLTLTALHSRPWLIRLRDGLARMGIPYL
jgi:cardiolipin synthase